MNRIVIELCPEDRERIDRLTAHLEKRVDQVQLVIDRDYSGPASNPVEAAQNDAGDAEASTQTETPAKEEKPTAPTETKPQPAVTLEQIQQKVVQLAAGGAKKAKVREIINAYGTKVSDLKEQPDKWTEVWDRLTALEEE